MKLILLYTCHFILFSFCTLSAQHTKDIDTISIKNKLDYELRKSLNKLDYIEAFKITNKMETYALQKNDSLFLASTLSTRAILNRFKNNLPETKKNLKKSIHIYEKYNHYSELVSLNSRLADIFRKEGKLDSSFFIFNRIEKKYLSDTISQKSIRTLYNIKELSYYASGRIDSTIYMIFKRIELINESNYYLLGNANATLAKVFYRVDDLSKAIEYIDKSLAFYTKESNRLYISKCSAYILKAQILLHQKKHHTAKLNVYKARDLIKNKGKPDYTLQIKTLLAKIYWETKQHHELSEVLYQDISAEKVTNATLFEYFLVHLNQSVSKKDWNTVTNLIKKLSALLPHISSLHLKQSFFKLSSIYWAKVRNFKKSYEAQNQYLKTKEKIDYRQQTYTIYDLDQKYQLAKKNKEIVYQKFKIKEQENQLLRKEKHQTYLTLSILSAILGFFSLLFMYRQRQKFKNNEILTLHRKQEIVKLESLIDGEEKERNRLAQDLHDGINGDLSAIKYKITSIEPSKLSEKEKIAHNEAIQILDNTVEQVRRISHNLAPSALLKFSLIEVIQQFCDRINASDVININFQYFGDQLKLEKEKETAIYRITQELTNNIIKHAKATETLIQINKYENKLHITIEDNGIGFNIDAKSHGIGLQNIKSRISLLNANLDIHSSKEGTSFNIEIDLNKI